MPRRLLLCLARERVSIQMMLGPCSSHIFIVLSLFCVHKTHHFCWRWNGHYVPWKTNGLVCCSFLNAVVSKDIASSYLAISVSSSRELFAFDLSPFCIHNLPNFPEFVLPIMRLFFGILVRVHNNAVLTMFVFFNHSMHIFAFIRGKLMLSAYCQPFWHAQYSAVAKWRSVFRLLFNNF